MHSFSFHLFLLELYIQPRRIEVMDNINRQQKIISLLDYLNDIFMPVDLSYTPGHAGPFREVEHVLNLQNELGAPGRHNFCH